MIKITLSTDLPGLPYISTVLAATARRSNHAVVARVYTAGFEKQSFSSGNLTVEFIRTDAVRAGNYPGHVPPAVFDRLQVIPEAVDWDRCLVMDHDMLPLCDLAPYFEEDFEGNLLLGRLFGPGNTLGLQMQSRGGLPRKLKYAEDYPYFFMGPMMNLKAMRKAGTWNKLLRAHQILKQEEQMALTIATEGKVKGVGKKWNLVPQWDHLEKGPQGQSPSGFGTVGEPPVWKNGLPEGLIHWTGYAKPWHYASTVWRADLWESEETSWESLRRGWWQKPRVVEIGPENHVEPLALARRGWRVDVCSDAALKLKPKCLPFPDLHWQPRNKPKQAGPAWLAKADMVRFGARVDVREYLTNDGCAAHQRPARIVLRGPCTVQALKGLRKLGYTQHARIERYAWAAGGPACAGLDYEEMSMSPQKVGEGEDLYLWCPQTDS